jgi:hypothetical protein
VIGSGKSRISLPELMYEASVCHLSLLLNIYGKASMLFLSCYPFNPLLFALDLALHCFSCWSGALVFIAVTSVANGK